MTVVRPAAVEDRAAWLALRSALWPDEEPGEHEAEVARYFADASGHEPCVVLLAHEDDRVVGFAEASVRPCAEGCRTRDVAYLEGWYVAPEARRSGVGRALVAAVESWGRARGCRELASDTEPENDVSRLAHRASGFEDVGLVRCFRKELGPA